MSKDKADEARTGLFDAVAGKAKEVAGAVTGHGGLVEEGQLQQADAQARKDANAQQAIAEAHSQRTARELREQTADATADKREAYARAGEQERSATQDAVSAEAAADAEAE